MPFEIKAEKDLACNAKKNYNQQEMQKDKSQQVQSTLAMKEYLD